jgi:hypothetical protein
MESVTYGSHVHFGKVSARQPCSQESVIEKLCPPNPSTGIFQWSNSTRKLVTRTNFKDSQVYKDKQLRFVGHMTEMSHGLLICESHNISNSFGFELPMGIFPK